MAKTLSVKTNAPILLERQLSRRAKEEEYGIIALSSSTEPYMQVEGKLKLTRKLLEIILNYNFPVEIATKSRLVIRDLDIFKFLQFFYPFQFSNKQSLNGNTLAKISGVNTEVENWKFMMQKATIASC
ncbi:MAG: hypothetical protein QXJ17_07320 [Nitrososphaeria archaeon]